MEKIKVAGNQIGSQVTVNDWCIWSVWYQFIGLFWNNGCKKIAVHWHRYL